MIRDKKQQEDFGKNQGKEVLEKIKKAISSIKSVFPSAGIPVNGQPNATQTVTNAPAGQTVNSNNTPNADDRNILSTASSNYTLNVSTLTNGFLKIEGNIGSTQLSKNYTLKISMISTQGMGSEITIGETQLIPNSNGQKNGFSFTTDKSYRLICDQAADQRNQSIAFQVQVKEYPEYKFPKAYKVMNYDCPTRNLLPGDVVTDQVYNNIEANPCGICYPNGGRNIRINGKDCLPNTAPVNTGDIYDITTTKQGNKITGVKFTIKPSAGLWKIFASDDDTICGGMSAYNQSEGTIASDGQSISYDINAILDNCDEGQYTITLRPIADPRTASGQNDPSREQKRGKYIVQGTK